MEPMIQVDTLDAAAEAALRSLVDAGAALPQEALATVAEPRTREALASLLVVATERAPVPAVRARLGPFEVREVMSGPDAALCVRTAAEGGEVVLKELDDATVAGRARTLLAQLLVARSASSAVARPLGFAGVGGHVFIVRPHVPGTSLARILATLAAEEVPPDAPTWRLAAGARGGGANVTGAKMVCRIGQFTAQALADVHAAGAVHGALKPENLICDDTVKPTVTDFGCGHPEPPYEAPEVIRAEDRERARDAVADLYALGAVLHLCLTRRALFGGDPAQVEQATLAERPVRPLKVNFKASREMDTISMALLEKDPTRRYRSAMELKDDLDRYHRNDPIVRRPPGLLERLFG